MSSYGKHPGPITTKKISLNSPILVVVDCLFEMALFLVLEQFSMYKTQPCTIYLDTILKQHVCLFMDADILFMDDNAHPPCASIMNEYFEEEDITA